MGTGIKSSLRDGLLNTRATLFLMKDDNIAAQAYDDQGIAITNTYWATGRVETQGGWSWGASSYLSQNWMVMAKATFTDIEEKAGDHNPKFDTIPRHSSHSGPTTLADWVQRLHLRAG